MGVKNSKIENYILPQKKCFKLSYTIYNDISNYLLYIN
jgi:hypothetical protein